MIIRSVAIALEDPLEVTQESFALFLFNNKSPILACTVGSIRPFPPGLLYLVKDFLHTSVAIHYRN